MSDDDPAYSRETLPEDALRAELRKLSGRGKDRPPTKPTHRLRLKDMATGHTSSTIGAAWASPDGSFNLRLDPGCALSYDSLKGKVLKLWPVEKEDE